MRKVFAVKSQVIDFAQGISMAFLAAIISTAQILGVFSPFGLSVVMAMPKEHTLFAMAGSIIGYAALGNISQNGIYISAVLIAGVFKLFFNFKVKRNERRYLIYSVASALALFGVLIVSAIMSPVSIPTIFLYVAETALCGCMTFVLSIIFYAFAGNRTEYRIVEKASFSIICILIFIALAPFEIAGIRLVTVLAVMIICVAMNRFGYSGGTFLAILYTIAMTLYDTGFAVNSGFLIVAGFIGGVFKPLGKMVQSTMFIATATFAAMVLGTNQISTLIMAEVFAGTILFYFLPDKLIKRFAPKEKVITAEQTGSRGITSRLDFTADTLVDLQHSIEEVSEHMETIAENDIFDVYTKTSKKICNKCGLNSFCWIAAYSDTMQALRQTTKVLRTKGKVGSETIPHFFRQKCCQLNTFVDSINLHYKEYLAMEAATRRVTEARLVAISQLEGISSMLCEMSKEFAEIHVPDCTSEDLISSILHEVGYSPNEICCYKDKYDRMFCDIYLPERPSDKALKEIGLAIEDKLDCYIEFPSIISSESNTKISYFEKATYSIDFHTSQISNQDNKYCGDSYEFFTDSKGFAHIILSDGMGSGARAAVDSKMTCSVAQKLLQTGFGFDAAFQLVNLSFLVKSRDESLATLDVCSIDMYTGMTEFAKAGSSSSFVLRGGKAVKVDCSSLPIGILQGIKYDRQSMKLGQEDIILMVSDGATATGEDWIASELELCKSKSAKEISQKICSEAQRRRIDGHSDDVTVLVARIKK